MKIDTQLKVWLSTTTKEFEKRSNTYLKIRDVVLQNKCKILFDWIPEVFIAIKKNPNQVLKRDIKAIYVKIINAINDCDVCIIEYTIPNFSTSHQINYSLHCKKPTLVLISKSEKEKQLFISHYLYAIEDKNLVVEEYNNLEEARQIISDFVLEQKSTADLNRYNIVLDKESRYKLNKLSLSTKKSKSQIIRELILNNL